jgi:hypothetical protein
MDEIGDTQYAYAPPRGQPPNALAGIFKDLTVSRVASRSFGGGELDLSDEIMRETGFEREKDAFDLRMEALTKPELYKGKRQRALNEVGLSVQEAYKNTYKLYIQSGEPHEKAKDAAKKAGMNVKQLQMKQFHVRFPDADVAVYQQKTVKDASAFVR